MAQVSRWCTELSCARRSREYDPRWRELDPQWAELRDQHLLKHPRCAARSRECSGGREVHHVGPKHLYPELRYHAGNLLTLCYHHHLTIGHGGDWNAWLPDVRRRAEDIRRAGRTDRRDVWGAEKARIWHRIPWRVEPSRSRPAAPPPRPTYPHPGPPRPIGIRALDPRVVWRRLSTAVRRLLTPKGA